MTVAFRTWPTRRKTGSHFKMPLPLNLESRKCLDLALTVGNHRRFRRTLRFAAPSRTADSQLYVSALPRCGDSGSTSAARRRSGSGRVHRATVQSGGSRKLLPRCESLPGHLLHDGMNLVAKKFAPALPLAPLHPLTKQSCIAGWHRVPAFAQLPCGQASSRLATVRRRARQMQLHAGWALASLSCFSVQSLSWAKTEAGWKRRENSRLRRSMTP